MVAWDDVKSSGQAVPSANWNEHVNQTKQRHKYHGFENRADSLLTWTDSTPDRTLTVSGTYKYYYQGTLIQKTGASDAAQITNTRGLWWIYFDSGGTLTANQGFPALATTVVVATVWWNGTYGHIYDERHGYGRNLDWHGWAHQTIGIRYQTGLAFTFTPATPTIAFALGSGTLWDEDIAFSVPASSTYVPTAHAGRIFYKTAASTFVCADAVSTRPYKWNSSSSRVQFVDSSNSHTLTDCSDSKYVNMFLYGTMDKNVLSSGNGTNAMFVVETIADSNGWNSASVARQQPVPDISAMGLNPEIKLLYRIVVKGDGTVQTAVSTDDFRNIAYGVAGGTAGTTASAISFTPAGTVSASNVQAAIEEVDSEKATKIISDYRTLDAAGVSVPKTAPAVVDQAETANGINYDYVKFEKNGGSTTVGIEFMQWNMKMPDDWNEGTIVADVDWLELTGDTTGRVAFILKCRRYLNADINTALAAGCTFDNASNISGGAGFVSKTVAPAAFAITGAGSVGKFCVFELTRVTPAAGTDVNAPVRVLGVNLKITRTLA